MDKGDGRMGKGAASAAGNLLRKSEEYLNLASAGVIVFMLLLVAVSVILRRTVNRPIVGVYEGSELCMIILVYLGLAYTQMRGRNVRVTILYDRLPAKGQCVVDTLVLSLSAMFWALLTWQSLLRAVKSWQMHEASLAVIKFPLYPGWTMIPIGAGLLTIELLVEIFHSLRRWKTLGRSDEGG